MARKNKWQGITIELNGDATGLDKALKDVDSNIRQTQLSLKEVQKLERQFLLL